jgi:hypothetical protein
MKVGTHVVEGYDYVDFSTVIYFEHVILNTI